MRAIEKKRNKERKREGEREKGRERRRETKKILIIFRLIRFYIIYSYVQNLE